MPQNSATPKKLWDPYWAKYGSDQDEEDSTPITSVPEETASQLSEGLTTGSVQSSGGLTTVGPQGEARPFSATYIPNTYNGKPTVGANMGGNGLSSGARFLEQYVETPFDQKGFRQTGSATEYDPSKDQMARSVVDGVVVPRQVGAPIQIDPKYGGGVGTVTNPFSSSMGSTAPAAPSFAAPPERQPISYTTATGSITTDPAKQFLSSLDGLKEWSRSRGGGLKTPGVQSSNGLGGGSSSDADTLARRLQAQDRFDYKIAQAAARRNGIKGRVPRAAIGLGGASPGEYEAEARRVLEERAQRKAALDEWIKRNGLFDEFEKKRREANAKTQDLRK